MASAPTAHVPPQNIEAEESVLGAMLVAESTLTRVIDEVKLNAADFYLDKHREIFGAIHDLYAASKPVDELSVSEALTQHNKIEEAGGRHYVSELAAKVPAAANAKRLVRLDGVSSPRAAQAILSVLPLDDFEPHAAFCMEMTGSPGEVPPVCRELEAALAAAGYAALALTRSARGAGQRAGHDDLVPAETVAQLKGRDMMVGRFAELLGLST